MTPMPPCAPRSRPAKLIAVTLLVFTLGQSGAVERPPAITGEARVAGTVELSFAGPAASVEQSAPNPFLDYRLQVAFAAPSGRKTYHVAGFFDGDGRGGARGDVWRVRFTPDEKGTWRYRVSFRRGPQVAVALEPGAGAPADFDGQTGTLAIAALDPSAPGFRKWGRLEYVGKHYLKFQYGPYWIRGGTDSPEDLLGYAGFDRTPPRHHYADHVADWRPGDPDWGGGKGRGIIGALNHLAHRHVNSIYFLTHNIGGDFKNVWPWAGSPAVAGSPANDNLRFDVGKLRQWEIVFDHAQRQGIFLHFVLNEAEKANKQELDDGELGPERKLYYREIIARFGHHLALQWNLCEEYNIDFDFGPDRIRAFADYLRAIDPYGHPIAVHSAREAFEELKFMFGDERFSMLSVQLSQDPIDSLAERLRTATARAGRPLPVSMDEFTVYAGQAVSYHAAEDAELMRIQKLWPTYLSGGNIEFILPEEPPLESFKTPEREKLWHYVWYARRFLESLPFWEMEPADSLLQGADTLKVVRRFMVRAGMQVPNVEVVPVGKVRLRMANATYEMGAQVYAVPGRVYAIYLPSTRETGTLDLTGAPGGFRVRWYNPRTGEFVGAPRSVTGGAKLPLGPPPADPGRDWTVLFERVQAR